MHVHPSSVVVKKRFWHECCSLSMFCCNISYYIFVHHHLVCHSYNWGKSHVNLALSCSGNLMMVAFNVDSGLAESFDNLVSYILQGVSWRHRKISFLWPDFVSKV